MERFIWTVCAALGAVVVAVNIWYRKDRAAMTPEERKRDDDEANIDIQTW